MIYSPIRSPLSAAIRSAFETGGAASLPAWSPASAWFAASEQGIWLDPSDLSTMFQDSAGTLPVTAVEQPVGRILDKSGRGNHATQATSTARPTLRNRYNLLLATATLSTQSVSTLAAGYQLRFAGAGSITLSGTATGTYSAGTHSITCTAGTLTLTVSGAVATADLLAATDSALPYQSVTTSTSYNSDPSKFPLYLAFDGSDDSLATAAIDFSATDEMTVVAGVSSLVAAAGSYPVLVELSAAWFSNNGVFNISAAGGPAAGSVSVVSKGTIANAPSYDTGIVAPKKDVVSLETDLSLDITRVRRNGAQVINSSGDVGTGTFGNYPLYIGSRGGTTARFNGRLHQLIVRGKTSADIADAESFVAGKTGVTL